MDENKQSLLRSEDYDAIEAAVMETERGRWFLKEYARRNRVAETASLLDSIHKLEQIVVTERASQDAERIRFELSDMARMLTKARRDILCALHRPADEAGYDLFNELAKELEQALGDNAAGPKRALEVLRYVETRIATLIEVWGADDEGDIEIFRGKPRRIGISTGSTLAAGGAQNDDGIVFDPVRNIADGTEDISAEWEEALKDEALAETVQEPVEPEAESASPDEELFAEAAETPPATGHGQGPVSIAEIDGLSYEDKVLLFG